jgi:vesicle-fusing ATPase
VLLRETHDDPREIQARYEAHRTKRNEQQKAKLLNPMFEGLVLDTILQRLLDPLIEPGFVDPRHSITVWARPTGKVKDIAAMIQQRLLAASPSEYHNQFQIRMGCKGTEPHAFSSDEMKMTMNS